MKLRNLYESLHAKFGAQSDPDTWWPIYYGRTDPGAFERAFTNVLVTRSQWPTVRRAVDALDQAGLLTAKGMAKAEIDVIAACAKPTGFQADKANTLKALGQLVVSRFQTEAGFCAKVTADQLRAVRGIGPETADRIVLYTSMRFAWPVDTYCLRVLAHHQIIATVPTKVAEKRTVTTAIKQMVENQMPHTVLDWQRLHALMQLEGEDIRRGK